MISARLRTTLIYAASVTVIALVLGVVVTRGRESRSDRQAAREALRNAEVAAAVIDWVKPQGGSLLVNDSMSGGPILDPHVADMLRSISGYLIVIGRDSMVHFASRDVSNLDDESWQIVSGGMNALRDDGPAGIVRILDGKVVLVAVSVKDPTTGLVRVIAGMIVDPLPPSTEQRLALFLIMPIIVVISSGLVWFLLGGPFDRLDRVRRELAAITDGRSLHRRLSIDEAGPELTQLIETLNAMIARLESSFMALRRFTADASHELKTPLAVLRADVERSMHDKTSKTEKMVALEEALHEVTRMSDLVDSLLTLARADEGRFELHREPVDLRELAQEVYETALILGEAAGVSVHFPFTAEATIPADRARLRQLFLNLVTNAIKYTPQGGRIDIGLGKHPTTVTFAVRDTGIGIAAADLSHIFERFWRADRVRSRAAERGGVGLGLSISQWIAQAHGGTLTVSSRLGKGSLFTVTLPLDS